MATHPAAVPPDEVAEIVRLAREGVPIAQLAAQFKRDRHTIRKHLRRSDWTPAPTHPKSAPAETPARPEPAESFKVDGDRAERVYVTGRMPRNEQEAVAAAGIDTAVWRVHRYEVTTWQVAMKVAAFERTGGRAQKVSEAPHLEQCWRVWLDLRRILPQPFLDAGEALLERIARHAPRYPPPKASTLAKAPFLCVLGLFDAHFGKLAWAKEVGEDYDLKIAERIFSDALSELLAVAAQYKVARFAFPIGNDFYQIDGPKNTTTAGTIVDTDGRYAKIIEAGEMALIRGVERAAALAPVDVFYLPGNHDKIASWHATRAVRYWFRSCPHVRVDVEPTTRKYLRHGECLLGFIHGNDVRLKDLPNLMASERRREWGETRHREWLAGHIHRKTQFETMPVEETRGVVVRTLSALTGTDSWHYDKTFVNCQRAAEAFFYHERHGLVLHATVPVTGLDTEAN